MQKKTLLTAMLAAGYALSVQAEQFIEPIIVTATRTAQTVDETLASVTVITREEIERLQPAQLSDLLQSRAGIHIASNGPFGKNSSLFLRGSNSGHTLLLIDGVRMGSATSGGASWQFLPASEIERIEIVRGPRTSIYGADAIGGVIQIFTRQGTEGSARTNAHARIGSFNTREIGAGVRGGNEQTTYSLSASHHETDGINLIENIGDDERDGYRNTSLSLNIRHQLENKVELFTNGLYSTGQTEYDNASFDSPYSDFVHGALSAGLKAAINEAWLTELTLSHASDRANVTDSWPGYFDTFRDQIDWRNDFTIGNGTLLTAGIDWHQDRVKSTTSYDENSRDNVGVYQILQTELNHHNLQGSLRYDDNEAYGNQTTGALAWGYALSPQLRSRLSWGSAFKAPTFNQLYWPGFGNPALQPEESESYEVGLRYTQAEHFFDVALFETTIKNLIAGQPVENLQARIRGIEVDSRVSLQDWTAAASLTLLNAEDRDTGNELARRPGETLRLDLDYRLGHYNLGSSVVAQGRSYENADNTDRIAGHAVLNLRGAWRMDRHWTWRATIDNVLDKEYATTRHWSGTNYNQPGRAAYLSVHYQQ
ncbi:MAG: TonB-dependent receptor [Chromatiales bacterium]|nr:TonB-dependent receptor [Chromatiales bacterium]